MWFGTAAALGEDTVVCLIDSTCDGVHGFRNRALLAAAFLYCSIPSSPAMPGHNRPCCWALCATRADSSLESRVALKAATYMHCTSRFLCYVARRAGAEADTFLMDWVLRQMALRLLCWGSCGPWHLPARWGQMMRGFEEN